MKHCIERYGRAEVEQWYWEVWNEPNIPRTGARSPQEFYKLHDYAIAAVRRALPTARVGGPRRRRARAARSWKGFLQHVVQRHQLRDRRRPARRRTSSPSTRRARRRSWTATCAWASPISSRRSTAASQMIAAVPELQTQADRDRRIGSRRLRGVPGPAARLPQRNDVLELHRGELRAEAPARREARREPRGRAHVGVRVRGPALLRRLPRARHATASTSRC